MAFASAPLRAAIAAAAVLLLAWLLIGPLTSGFVAHKLRAAAGGRGLEASWRALRGQGPGRWAVSGLKLRRRAGGDTLFRADSALVAIEWGSLFRLSPQLGSLDLWHARLRLPAARAAVADTLVPDPDPRRRGSAGAARTARLKRSVDALVRLAVAPARQLPRLSFTDLEVTSGSSDEALWRGVRIGWLDLTPAGGGIRLAATGALLLEREIPFALSLAYGRDDRLSGGARFLVSDPERKRVDTVLVTMRGTLHQSRLAGRVAIGDSTTITIGRLPVALHGRLERRGPALQVEARAEGVTEDQVVRSLPPSVLGPLLLVKVRGSWDYRLALDLDLSQPDSVTFEADVTPHRLVLDPARTTLPLFGLDRPFVAAIQLPRRQVQVRELSEANPSFRPLDRISPHLVYAVVTNEDGGFFRHRGFNPEAVKQAIAENLKAGAFRRGAGTITMQLARNLYAGHARTLSRKGQEVVLAWVLEHLTGLSKQRLLEIYLNIIEWGPGVHGAGEAARYYFDRDPSDLTIDQALFLSTVVPAPNRWRSRFAPDGSLRDDARAQMHFIGRAMTAKGWLDPAALPPTDSLQVELAGRARAVLFPPDTVHADTLAH
ncbi:MAG TPA: biosynthetic peptidoglycan transglycosylase [Candidatus Limnocylindria bacterium]|nr:biosynthetic peptidoglycan transglycosylase [Candidatus Limnocylindria bacterium]